MSNEHLPNTRYRVLRNSYDSLYLTHIALILDSIAGYSGCDHLLGHNLS